MSSNSHKSILWILFRPGTTLEPQKDYTVNPEKKNVLRNCLLDIELDCHVTNQKNHGTLWNLVLLRPCTSPWKAVKSKLWRRFESEKKTEKLWCQPIQCPMSPPTQTGPRPRQIHFMFLFLPAKHRSKRHISYSKSPVFCLKFNSISDVITIYTNHTPTYWTVAAPKIRFRVSIASLSSCFVWLKALRFAFPSENADQQSTRSILTHQTAMT